MRPNARKQACVGAVDGELVSLAGRRGGDFTLSRAVSLRRIARYVTEISNASALINFPAIIPVNPIPSLLCPLGGQRGGERETVKPARPIGSSALSLYG